VIGALRLMKLPLQQEKEHRVAVVHELVEGIQYVFNDKKVLSLISLIGITGLFGFSFVTLFPAWSVEILHRGVETNGLLMSARGVGALIAALGIASMGKQNLRGRILTIGTFVGPILMLIFSLVSWLPLSLFVLMGIGGAMILIVNLINSLIQTHVSDEFRGRVMSIYSLIFFGSMSLGALIIGEIAGLYSERSALVVGSAVLLLFACVFWFLVPAIRNLE
jgi:MFS family permease